MPWSTMGLVCPHALEEVTLDALDAVLDVNLRTAVQLTQACEPAMREVGWGRVGTAPFQSVPALPR